MRRSTSGNSVTRGSHTIMARNATHTIVAVSIAEAVLCAVARAASEGLVVVSLLWDMRQPSSNFGRSRHVIGAEKLKADRCGKRAAIYPAIMGARRAQRRGACFQGRWEGQLGRTRPWTCLRHRSSATSQRGALFA